VAETQSVVEILLKVQSEKAELAAVQAQLAALNKEIDASKVASVGASEASKAWNAEQAAFTVGQQRLLDAITGVRSTVGKTASDFAPASAAMREFSLRAEENAVSAEKLSRSIGFVARDVADFIPGAQGVGRELQYLGQDFIGLGSEIGILNTVLIGAGIGAALGFAAALAAATVATTKFIEEGVKLNGELEKVKIQLAGTFQQFDPAIKNFDASLKVADAAMALITQKANEHQISQVNLAKSFSATSAVLSNAGVSFRNQINLVTQLEQAQRALGITNQQLVQELNQIFEGNVRATNILAQKLDLNKKEVESLRQTGELYDTVSQGLQKFAQAGDELRNSSLDGQMERIKTALENLAIEAAKPFLKPATDAAKALADALNDPALVAGFSEVAKSIAQLGQAAVIAAGQVANLIAILSGLENFRFLFGGAGGGGSVGGPQGLQDRINAAYEASFGYGDYTKSAAIDRSGASLSPQVELDRQLVIGKPISGGGGGRGRRGGGGGGGGGPSVDTQDQQEISKIQSEINEKEQAYHALIEKSNAAHQLGKQTLGEMQATNLKAGQEFIATIDKEEAKLVEMKAKVEAVGTAQGVLNDKEQTQVNKLQAAIDKLEILKAKTQIANQKDTWIGQWTSGLQKFGEQLSFTGDKAVATFQSITNTGIDGMTNALSGLISGTKNWEQSFVQAGESILNMLIKVALQALIGAAIQNSAHESTKFKDAAAAARGVYASASEIPWFGWIIAPIAAAAAFAACLAFAEGGIVPGAPSGTDNRLAMVASGEGIVTARAVSHYGPDMIHAMNSMSFAPSFATGGVVGGSPASSASPTSTQPKLNFAFFDDRQALAKWLRSTDGRKIVVDHVRNAANEIGIPSNLG